ncbi:30S ribosomal protein S9 [Desulfomicrobium sp. ZS1]|jgi:small subunit ribosomal protein S9|uniref:Small ribosomal subunit protein uS9 n=3 Tax=Desulfomicrobium TaxID=898 RepID=C7LSG4_DESBD|nr:MULTISPECIES: 30S ribosomal protein S9 [Desulfomicrobium]PKN40629.1 MAG: 30S ribosomal protein S9 [Deltaproteobacteria bacterium HGW-Deltaproteobacteria-18]ACU88178.1 ribosomal protein S9 [Desulfomicrobium baculatum DSM 4028]MBE1423674.1 small subunit ribosomal protein S9 [Desulfomicrobium macestii]UTF50347.1 30S ribosomal protein S9 [Desulfomicrobium sp. ZS1]SFL34796.1 small subunit ribosomal protein S9 [Desulfomicrobium norvegicum]
MSQDFFYGTGKRKTSVSRTRLYKGTGTITVNGRELGDYFPRATLQMIIRQPLKLTKTLEKFNIACRVTGGGLSGQAQAVRHGISRALLEFDPEMRGVLKRAGFLTRDSRVKERKKYGQRAARARFQYSKR